MTEWKEGILSEISDITMGQSPKGESCNNIGNGEPLLNGPTEFGLKYPDPVQFTTEPTKNCKEGDILFCVRGSTTGRMNWANKEYVIGRGLAAFRHKKGLGYQYFLKGLIDYKLDFLLASATGSTFPNVSRELLENMEIHLPPLPEQRAIAGVLSSLDDKIDLLHRQNKTLEAMAEALFRQWFVEEADAGWGETTLASYATNIRENATKESLGNHKNYVGLEHIPRKNIALDQSGNTDSLGSNKSVFHKGDILFGKLRSYFHKVVFAPFDGVCSTDILVIRPTKKEYFPFCLFWFFNEKVVEHSDLGSGGTRMPRTNWDIVSSYLIPKPNEDLIKIFSDIVAPWLGKISENIEQVRHLESLRDTLLPKLMSGEVRLAI